MEAEPGGEQLGLLLPCGPLPPAAFPTGPDLRRAAGPHREVVTLPSSGRAGPREAKAEVLSLGRPYSWAQRVRMERELRRGSLRSIVRWRGVVNPGHQSLLRSAQRAWCGPLSGLTSGPAGAPGRESSPAFICRLWVPAPGGHQVQLPPAAQVAANPGPQGHAAGCRAAMRNCSKSRLPGVRWGGSQEHSFPVLKVCLFA
jgi:hypothetical protein